MHDEGLRVVRRDEHLAARKFQQHGARQIGRDMRKRPSLWFQKQPVIANSPLLPHSRSGPRASSATPRTANGSVESMMRSEPPIIMTRQATLCRGPVNTPSAAIAPNSATDDQVLMRTGLPQGAPYLLSMERYRG